MAWYSCGSACLADAEVPFCIASVEVIFGVRAHADRAVIAVLHGAVRVVPLVIATVG